MKKWWQKIVDQAGFTIKDDPYGHSVQDKPRFLFQGLIERLIVKTAMPEDQQRMIEDLAGRGRVVYAIKYRSQFDFVYLSLRLFQLGLPVPSFIFDLHPYFWQPRWYALKVLGYHFWYVVRNGCRPDPYTDHYYRDKLSEGKSGLLFLVGKRGYYKRAVLVGNDPVEHLVEIQSQSELPIFVVPLVLLYTRNPGKQRRGVMEMFLGHREQPGPVRKFLSFLQGYSSAALEAGEPLNLQAVLPELSENLSERRKQIFQLRRELIDSVDEIRRAIVGPTVISKLELKEIILHHPRLEAHMQRRARSTKQEVWKIRKEADQYLDEIAADYNYTMINVGEKIGRASCRERV